MGLNLLFLPFWSIFIVIPFGRFFLLPGKSWIVFVSCRSMDFSPWCEYSPGPNECVGCNCVDEVEVFAPTTPPGYYSSSFVGEGRSGMSRPTTSCILLVAHYRSVDSPGPVVVLFYYCLHLRSSCVVLLPLLLPLDLPVVPDCQDDLESFLLFVCLMDLTDICNVGGPEPSVPPCTPRHPLLVSFSSPSWYRDVSRAPLVSLLKRWNWFGCLFFCCFLFDGQNRFYTSGWSFPIFAHLRSL